MSSVCNASDRKAKSRGERHCVKNASSFVAFDKIINVIKATWPTKTAANVAHVTGASERTVQFWLAGKTRMSVEAVAALMRTDAGYEILEAIIGDKCAAEWWTVAQVAHGVRESRKAIRKEQDRIVATAARLDAIDQTKL